MANNTNTVQEAEKLKNEGNKCLNAGQYKEAVEKYTQALTKIFTATTAKDITDTLAKDFTAKVMLTRADAYLKLGEWALAYANANEALRHFPDNFMGLMHRAKARLNVGFEAGAVEDIEKALKIKPGDITAGELLKVARERAAQVEIERQRKFKAVGGHHAYHIMLDFARHSLAFEDPEAVKDIEPNGTKMDEARVKAGEDGAIENKMNHARQSPNKEK